MSSVRSFIVRIYGRGGPHELSGTLEAVTNRPAGAQPPQVFSSESELLRLMRARRLRAPRDPGAKGGEPG